MLKYLGVLSVLMQLILSGCYLERDINYSLTKQPLIKKRTVTEVLQYQPRSRVLLTDSEKVRLQAALTQIQGKHRYEIRIIGFSLDKLKSKTLNASRLNHILKFFEELGVPATLISIDTPQHSARVPFIWEADTLAISIDYYVLHPFQCPEWNQTMDGRVPPEGESNFGCTNESNLTKMIADPKDLYVGKDLESSDGHYSSMSVERYHEDKVKTLKIETLNSTNT